MCLLEEGGQILDQKALQKQASLVSFLSCLPPAASSFPRPSPPLEQEQRGGGEDSDEEGEPWGGLEGEVMTVDLQQNNYGLGISLAGAKVPS